MDVLDPVMTGRTSCDLCSVHCGCQLLTAKCESAVDEIEDPLVASFRTRCYIQILAMGSPADASFRLTEGMPSAIRMLFRQIDMRGRFYTIPVSRRRP